MNDLQTARQLRKAAGYLRGHGWIQDDYGADGAPRCLVGALASGCRESVNDIENGAPVYKAIHAALDYTVHGPDGWNDEDGRTVDEVLDLLEGTATALEIRALAADKPAVESPAEKELITV